jgi:hypothetical protein
MFKFLLLNDFLRNLALKHCNPDTVTPVGVTANLKTIDELLSIDNLKTYFVHTVHRQNKEDLSRNKTARTT